MKFLCALVCFHTFLIADGPPSVLNLETALSLALNQNRQLLNTVDTVIRADYQVSVAYAEFELQIKPTGDVGYIGGGSAGSGVALGSGIDFSKKLARGTRISITPSFLKANERYRTNIKTVLTQPLLRGNGEEYAQANLRGAQFGSRTAYRSLYTAQCQLILRTITSLYDLLKAQKSIALNEESYKRVRRFYHAALVKSKIGLSEPMDVYRAELEMRQAEDALKASQERLLETEDALRDLLALQSDAPIQVDLLLEYTPNTFTLEQAQEIAFANRVELDQANDQLQENSRLSRIAKNRLWPELNLVINHSNVGQDQVFTETWRKKRESSWGVGFTTSSDFNPTAEKAAYEQALIAIETAQRGIDQTRANLTFEVRRVMRNLGRTQQRIELQAKQIKTAEGELRLSQLKFDRGLSNNFDLIQAEKSLSSAKLLYWNALIDHIVGEFQLLCTLGLLMEKPA